MRIHHQSLSHPSLSLLQPEPRIRPPRTPPSKSGAPAANGIWGRGAIFPGLLLWVQTMYPAPDWTKTGEAKPFTIVLISGQANAGKPRVDRKDTAATAPPRSSWGHFHRRQTCVGRLFLFSPPDKQGGQLDQPNKRRFKKWGKAIKAQWRAPLCATKGGHVDRCERQLV